MRTTIVALVAACVPVSGLLASIVTSPTSMNPVAGPVNERRADRNASGDTVGTDIVIFNSTSGGFLTNWSGIGIVGAGASFATNSVTSDEIAIDATQIDLGGGLFEYRFSYRNSSSATGLLAEFTPGGPVSIGGGAASEVTEHAIVIGTLDAFNDNIDSILGAALSIPDLNGAAAGNGITTILFDDNSTQDLGFFATIDGTGVDGSVFVSAGGADLGNFGIVGYDVRFQVQYVPAPAAGLGLAAAGLLARRRRR